MALARSTGTFVPIITSSPKEDRSEIKRDERNGHVVYCIDLNFRKLNEVEHIKWCRRNLGARHDGWDFWMVARMLYVEVWGEKQKFTYEMWKN